MTAQTHLTLHTLGKDPEQHAAWDAFVDACSVGSFFHLTGWLRVIEKVYGHTPHYLYAKDGDAIVGVLPLVEQKSLLFGHALISTPFCMEGGVASDDEAVMLFLEEQAMQLADKLGVDYLEMRYPFARNNPKLIEKCAHSTFACELAADDDAILAGIKKKQRAVVRHSLKNDLQYRVDQDATTAYDVYSESVRNLGTPVFPKHYFQALVDEFGERCDVLTVEHNRQAVSSVLSFYYKGKVMPFYGGGLHAARALKSNDFMYYRLMCDAKAKRDCTVFDFGRSKNDSGAYNYKRTWGMEPTPLHYQFYLVNADELPNLSPNNPKYQLFIKAWQKLPLWLSRLMGPFLSKYLG
ncbi:FemAB family PEP-CTERM system-associated protein [Aestuariibacter halophilus]|uniref:FemAB family PEP-CTERM system-associated protein n=1 Tax=Fluctibacter halophilus TaxID=226011 RepID=A0ABS8G2Q8_9ALTE|nr:FemAB family XrtA/PEP-CTERM system-associated protein [Aestuariibacter halophilus]MCC2614855.1 FemAB family PEP-CTERM system-associated protein [Aestuariibacter halophilus]